MNPGSRQSSLFLGEKPKRGCLTCTCPVQGALRPSPHGRLAGPEGGREAGSVCKLQAQRLLEPHPRPCSGGDAGSGTSGGGGGGCDSLPQGGGGGGGLAVPLSRHPLLDGGTEAGRGAAEAFILLSVWRGRGAAALVQELGALQGVQLPLRVVRVLADLLHALAVPRDLVPVDLRRGRGSLTSQSPPAPPPGAPRGWSLTWSSRCVHQAWTLVTSSSSRLSILRRWTSCDAPTALTSVSLSTKSWGGAGQGARVGLAPAARVRGRQSQRERGPHQGKWRPPCVPTSSGSFLVPTPGEGPGGPPRGSQARHA